MKSGQPSEELKKAEELIAELEHEIFAFNEKPNLQKEDPLLQKFIAAREQIKVARDQINTAGSTIPPELEYKIQALQWGLMRSKDAIRFSDTFKAKLEEAIPSFAPANASTTQSTTLSASATRKKVDDEPSQPQGERSTTSASPHQREAPPSERQDKNGNPAGSQPGKRNTVKTTPLDTLSAERLSRRAKR